MWIIVILSLTFESYFNLLRKHNFFKNSNCFLSIVDFIVGVILFFGLINSTLKISTYTNDDMIWIVNEKSNYS